jgi:DNA polymerase III subunit epsilon
VSWFLRRTPLGQARWVVLDCETSGLDPRRDHLLSVGALRVRSDRIELGGAFSARVRSPAPSTAENILVHGIGADAQRAAPPSEEVLPQLARYLEGAIAVAFHAWFDREVLQRAGLRSARRWLDLEPLAHALYPGKKLRTLDEWLSAFGIQPAARHDALLDALASAELLLVLLAQARNAGLRTVEELLSAAGKIPR